MGKLLVGNLTQMNTADISCSQHFGTVEVLLELKIHQSPKNPDPSLYSRNDGLVPIPFEQDCKGNPGFLGHTWIFPSLC